MIRKIKVCKNDLLIDKAGLICYLDIKTDPKFSFFVDDDDDAKKWVHKSTYDVQRSKLEKLMSNPTKPVFIPQPRKEKDVNKAADFQYNVMGSSAGAGSGEFHVYRQIRRKEADRQKELGRRKDRDDMNDAYHQKLEENEKAAEERTAKKRAKRQKKKQNALKNKAKKIKTDKGAQSENSSDSETNEQQDRTTNNDK